MLSIPGYYPLYYFIIKALISQYLKYISVGRYHNLMIIRENVIILQKHDRFVVHTVCIKFYF